MMARLFDRTLLAAACVLFAWLWVKLWADRVAPSDHVRESRARARGLVSQERSD